MKRPIGAKDVSIYFKLIDPATGVPETGLTITDLSQSYVRDRTAIVTDAAAAELAAVDSVHADYSMKEVGAAAPGLYRADWPDAAFASGVQSVQLVIKGAAIDPAYVEVELVGSVHEWYVAKNGNDTTHGGHSPEDAFLTIMAVVAVAADGDTVYIGPGTYDEMVDLHTTYNLALTLVGAGREKTIINPTSVPSDAMKLWTGCTVKHLKAIAGIGGAYAAFRCWKSSPNIYRITLEDVYGIAPSTTGSTDAVHALVCNNLLIKDSIFTGTYDCLITSGVGVVLENSYFYCDGTVTTADSMALRVAGGSVTARNCHFKATIASGNANDAYAVNSTGRVTLLNCTLNASNATSGGDALASHCASGAYSLTLENCDLVTSSADANAYDLSNAGGTLTVMGCTYDTTKTTGTITIMGSGAMAAVNAEADTALSDYDAPTKTEMDSAFTTIKGATFSATDTLEAIRDRGDEAWTTATSVTVSDKTGFSLANSSIVTATFGTCDFTSTMKTSLNAATPAVTVSDKTGFSLANSSIVTATFGTCDFTSTMKTSLNAATPAVTVSDKTGFSLANSSIVTATFGTCVLPAASIVTATFGTCIPPDSAGVTSILGMTETV